MELNNYEKYFLNDKNISLFQTPTIKTRVHLMEDVKDKLFWSFFIALKGTTEFEYLKMLHKLKITEKQLKIDFLEKIAARRKEITKKRVVKTVTTVEANLLEEKTSLETLVVLAFIEGINLFFVDERTFFCAENTDGEFHIIKHDEIIFENIEKIKENRIERYRVDKVLSSISNYKVDELKCIHDKLVVESTKMTKQQLYDNIIELCSIKN